MAAIYKADLTPPNEILWQDATRGAYPMKVGTTEVGFCFDAPNGNRFCWNFQYRYRARLGYAAYMEGTDELWTEWTGWQGSGDATVSGAYDITPVEIDGAYYAAPPVKLAVDSKYVCYEVQARARFLAAHRTNGTLDNIYAYGDWSPVVALQASFKPKVTELGATENADGSLTVTCNTSWGESGNHSRIAQVYDGTRMQPVNLYAPGGDDGWQLEVPAGVWKAVNGCVLLGIRSITGYGLRWDYSAFGTVSGGVFTFADGTTAKLQGYDAAYDYAAAEIGRRVESDSITAELSVQPHGTGLQLSITANQTLDYAYAIATWVDALGNAGTQRTKMAGNGKAWSADFPLIPFNTEVAFEARLGAGDEFAIFETKAALKANYASWTADDGTEVRLKWDVQTGGDWTPEAEAVKTMGANLPLSRYGRGGKNSITVSGKAISWDGTGWKPAFEKLKDGHDWTLRTADGEVRRVMVTSCSISTENGTANDIADVSVKCMEVEDG